jgi:hypothetical protein
MSCVLRFSIKICFIGNSQVYGDKNYNRVLIRELIDHIEVHENEGEGKYKTQRIVIFYRFVGYIEIPESTFLRL